MSRRAYEVRWSWPEDYNGGVYFGGNSRGVIGALCREGARRGVPLRPEHLIAERARELDAYEEAMRPGLPRSEADERAQTLRYARFYAQRGMPCPDHIVKQMAQWRVADAAHAARDEADKAADALPTPRQ